MVGSQLARLDGLLWREGLAISRDFKFCQAFVSAGSYIFPQPADRLLFLSLTPIYLTVTFINHPLHPPRPAAHHRDVSQVSRSANTRTDISGEEQAATLGCEGPVTVARE